MSSKYYITLLLSIFISCHSANNNTVEQRPYFMDQEPPGDIPKVFGEGIVSVKGRFDMGFSISPNGSSIAFGSAHESDPSETCIYIMNYSKGKWTLPNKSFLQDNNNTYFPMFGPHGNQLYFAKYAAGSDTDLWVAEYLEGKAVDPKPLDSAFNSNAREAGHGQSKKGNIYFTSNRDDKNACCGDIYSSKFESDRYTQPEKVEELNSMYDEESLFLSPNEDYIIVQAWKSEYEAKHDLFISYRNKEGSWSLPERLDININSKEIEQRPFVSSDNQFLFFSRTTITKEHEQDIYESDIYWVSTSSVFKPYVYNGEIKHSVKYMKPFEIVLPSDLFQDVNDSELSYHITLTNHSELPEWIKFEPSDLRLTGTWKSKTPMIINVSAIDGSENTGVFSFMLEAK